MAPKNVMYKKTSKDKTVGVYMAKRDFVDHVGEVDPVDGVILVDPALLEGKKVFVALTCVFRYGHNDGVDVLGIQFKREIYTRTIQAYPPLLDKEQSIHNPMQEKMVKKLGEHAYPFFFEFPDNLPCSVSMQPGAKDPGKICAVEFEVRAFSAEAQDAKVKKRSTVSLMLRKMQYAPESGAPAPTAKTDKPLELEASLGKETYYHGEPISVSVQLKNTSGKTVKNVVVSVQQISNVVLFSNDNYSMEVATEDTGDSVQAGESLNKTYSILATLANNKDRKGIALDGKLKHQDTNLASTSIIKEGVLKEVLGIMVSYKVIVKCIIAGMLTNSECTVELPFTLMHAKPEASDLEGEIVIEEFKRSNLKGMEDEEDGNQSAGEGT